MNKKSNIILIAVIIILASVALFSILLWPLFGTSDYRNLPEISFQGDGTYTMRYGDAVMLNNGVSISFNKVNNKDNTGYIKQTGMSTSIFENPSGQEVGVWLEVNNSRSIFLSPTDSEQQIIERGKNNDFRKPGVVMKLISIDSVPSTINKEKGEATISFRSITGNINLDNPFLVTLIIIIIQALLVFIAEFIIKRRSVNVLYRYTLYRSIIYTIPSLLLISCLDPEWGIALAIIFFPFVLIESIIVSFIAYRIVIKRKIN